MDAWNWLGFGSGRPGALSVKAALASMAVILAWGAAPGCVPSAGSYCKKVCDCTGCDEAAESSCVDTVGDAQHRASKKECGGEFDAYFSCLDAQTKCVDGAVDDDGCESEADTLTACAGDIGLGFGASCQTLCERAQQECGNGGDCATSCQQSEDLAQTTGCKSEYNAILACYSSAPDICNVSSTCEQEANTFVNCFISFCNQNPGTPGC